jgi:hypothetical protein
MTDTEAPASGVGLFTLSLAWTEGTGEMNLQVAAGGDWGNPPALAQSRLWNALKTAADKAQEAVIELAVQERMAKAASEAAVRG